MIGFVLRMKGDGPVYSVGLKGMRELPGRYFGGADFEDLWFVAVERDACLFKQRSDAERAATKYGCPPVRVFEVVEVDE